MKEHSFPILSISEFKDIDIDISDSAVEWDKSKI